LEEYYYYIYIHKTRLASNEIFSPSNKIHREVGRAKDLSAPLCMLFVLSAYLSGGYLLPLEEDSHPRVSVDSAGLCGSFLCPHVGLQNSRTESG